MKALFLGAEFMFPFWCHEVEAVNIDLDDPRIEQHADATFAYSMNGPAGKRLDRIRAARDACQRLAIPTIFHTIEDPNSFQAFLPQAAGYNIIATSDALKIPAYQEAYPGAKVIWLPLAAQPAIHAPQPLADNPADLVLIANWYMNDARSVAIRTVLDPLLKSGMTLALYAYQDPPFVWPEPYARWWRKRTVYLDVAQYYPEGQIAIGMNNQAWKTAMCSMRTFEALACGKPFLSFHSDAYERLGFVNAGPDLDQDGHFIWISTAADAVRAAEHLLAHPDEAAAMAERGRQFVLEKHTYAHRLNAILNAIF